MFSTQNTFVENFKNMYQTNVLLDNLYQKTESFLEKAVRNWQLLSDEQLNKQPAPNAWSAAQCLEHLNIYGRHYLPEIKKAIEKGEKSAETFKSGWLGDYFYRLMLPNTEGSLKSKMNAPKNAIPPVKLDSRRGRSFGNHQTRPRPRGVCRGSRRCSRASRSPRWPMRWAAPCRDPPRS